MELVVTIGLISLIIYLRYYADLRAEWEKETEHLSEGIELFNQQRIEEAFRYFDQRLQTHPHSGIAYLYRARCFRAMDKPEAAMQDLKKGASYDGSIPELHVEIGKLHFDKQDYTNALRDFDKAVFYAHGELASPYHWRGLALEKLDQPKQARQDLQKAQAITDLHRSRNTTPDYARRAFFDRRLLLNSLGIVANSALLLYIIKVTPVIHWPYLLAASSAALIGFIEPRKGWVLAILQAATIWLSYTFFTTIPQNSGQRELELFGLYGSMILTFISSFIGGGLKRQLMR